MRALLRLLLVLPCVACGTRDTDDHDAGIDAGVVGGECEVPDVMVLLDRTMSMHRRPNGTVPPDTVAGRAETKWSIAVDAVEALGSRFASSVRLGLTLFPRDPGAAACITQSERIGGETATNPSCEAGEVVVEPAFGSELAPAIDADTTLLCTSTPIGAGLATATTALGSIATPGREQYIVFVGDGRDTCDAKLALANTQAAAATGVRTFAIAFDGTPSGIDHGLLNDLACAGRMAHASACTDTGTGDLVAADREGPALYLAAEDADALTASLDTIIGGVCCGCIL